MAGHPPMHRSGTSVGGGAAANQQQTFNILRRAVAFVTLVALLFLWVLYLHVSGGIELRLAPDDDGGGIAAITHEAAVEAPDATEVIEVLEHVPGPPESGSDAGAGAGSPLLAVPVPGAAGREYVGNRAASRAGYDAKEQVGPPHLPHNITLATAEELRSGGLELISNLPPVYLYRKNATELSKKWEAVAATRGEPPSRVVKMACLYAGFVRDFENMFVGCRDKKDSSYCKNAKLRKFYGNQREYLLDSTDCDVYVSTWDIRGGGRFSTSSYDMRDRVDGAYVQYYYRHRAAAVHVQQYAAYQDVWRFMYKFRRSFPQMRPTSAKVGRKRGEESWSGRHETNELIRLNDYSQSYKHWVVVQLAQRSGVRYDLFYRLRCDLRMTSKLSNFRFDSREPGAITFEILQVESDQRRLPREGSSSSASTATGEGSMAAAKPVVMDDDADINKVLAAPVGATLAGSGDGEVTELNITHQHHVSPARIHTSNFDIADFGFMGTPPMIENLTSVWWLCMAPSNEWVPSVSGKSISEYNLLVWRIIFDSSWEVDSGGRYLWVSRRHGHNPRSGATTVVVKKIIIRKKPGRRK